MKNKKNIFIGLGILVFLVAVSGAIILLCKPGEKKEIATEDAKRFKEEYESLNGTVRESDKATYNSVSIPEVNPIKYVNTKETLDILKKETAVIYVGANWCPWCRNIVPILLDVAKDNKVDTIYYLDLDKEKSSFEVKNGKLEKTVNGTDSYYELLDFLKEELRDYVITSDKKEYKTGEKRIYMPFVLVCKNGKVEATHTGSTTLDEGQTKYDPLTKDQTTKVYNIYNDMFKKIIPRSTCEGDCD